VSRGCQHPSPVVGLTPTGCCVGWSLRQVGPVVHFTAVVMMIPATLFWPRLFCCHRCLRSRRYSPLGKSYFNSRKSHIRHRYQAVLCAAYDSVCTLKIYALRLIQFATKNPCASDNVRDSATRHSSRSCFKIWRFITATTASFQCSMQVSAAVAIPPKLCPCGATASSIKRRVIRFGS
jgi:hypothetical protein